MMSLIEIRNYTWRKMAEFATVMCKRKYYDPLVVAWFTQVQNYTFAGELGVLINATSHELFGGEDTDTVLRLLCGRVDFMMSESTEFIKNGERLGLWRALGKMNITYSNVFINRICTLAFVIMRPLIGKDVAGLIAKQIARMYLAERAWFPKLFSSTYTCKSPEQILRERICKEIGFIET